MELNEKENDIKLNTEEKLLYSQTREHYEHLRDDEYTADLISDKGYEQWMLNCLNCAEEALELCAFLARRGYKKNFYEFFLLYTAVYPQFFKYKNQSELLENVEALLFFIECNLDKEEVDKTLNVEFGLNIPGISKIWLTRIETGWRVKCNGYRVKTSDSQLGYWGTEPIETDIRCMGLIEYLRQEKVYFPREIDFFFEQLWRDGFDGLSVKELKQELDSLVDCFSRLTKEAEWVKTTLSQKYISFHQQHRNPVLNKEVSVYA